jgi:hypothetical protein
VQELAPHNIPARHAFCQWILHPTSTGKVLFMDKLNFTGNEIANIHNKCMLSDENGHVIQTYHQQQQFSIKVWVGILGDTSLGPHILLSQVSGCSYFNFL